MTAQVSSWLHCVLRVLTDILCLSADWIEHVLATGGEAYLMTPEDDLSFVVRHNLDVVATYLCGLVAAVFVVGKLLQILLQCVLAVSGRSKVKTQ